MFDINGDFRNVKRPTLSVTGYNPSGGAAPSSVPNRAAPAPSQSVSGSPAVSSTVGMGVGMAINNAIQMACYQLIGASDEDIERKACEIYEMAERLKRNAAEGYIAKDLVSPSPKRTAPDGAAEASQRQFDETFDDDIPF